LKQDKCIKVEKNALLYPYEYSSPKYLWGYKKLNRYQKREIQSLVTYIFTTFYDYNLIS